MFNYLFKSTTRSFARTLGRILAYIVIGALILFLGSFLHLSNVKAAEEEIFNPPIIYNSIFGTYIDSPVFYKDLGSGNIFYSSSRYNGTVSSSFYEYLWNGSTIGNYVTSDKGLGISSCSSSFVENNYYSITAYYVVFANPNLFYVHNSYAIGNNKIGLGPSESTALNNMSIVPTDFYRSIDSVKIPGKTSLGLDAYLMFNTIVFKADKNASCVSWAVNKNGGGLTSSNFDYVGYRISYQGTEPPSNDEVMNLITQESAIINSNIDAMKEKQDETNNKLDDVNNNITNDKVDGAQGSANDFFNNFEDNDYGFSDIIKIPLKTINKVTSGVCTPVSLPIPFVDTSLTLPCMSDIYNEYFGSFYTIYKVVTFGIIAYYVCINIFAMVKNFKNPDSDEIEVFEL